MKNRIFLILGVLLFLNISLISAESLNVYVKPLDGSGLVQPSTSFSYVLNFSTTVTCDNIVISQSNTITTGKDGIGNISVTIPSDLSSIPKFLCEYRDGSLRKVHNISSQFFDKVYADSINVTNNVTASNFIGNISSESISTGTINFARLPTLTNLLTLDWANITNKFITAVGGDYIYMSGTTATFNETKLNNTIDARDTDTTYTAGSNLTLGGTEFSLNTVGLINWLDLVYAGIGTIFDGTWSSITGKPTVLSNFTDDLGDRGYTDLSNFTNTPGYITTYSETDPLWTANQSSYSTTADIYAFGYYNSTDFVITDYYLNTNPSNYWNSTFATFNKTYADTLYADISITGDNSSFNESYTNTLYYEISNPSGFYNSSDFSISDYLTSSQVLGFGYYNSTDFIITNYYTKSEIENFGYYNSSDFSINDYLLISNWNSTNTSYYLITNPDNYWNDVYATYNKTYGDTLYVDITGDTMTGNLGTSGNLTASWGNFNTLNVTGTSYLGDITINTDNITVNNILSKDGNLSFFNNAGSEKVRITSTGNVGIGTTSPGAKLDITSTVRITGFSNPSSGTGLELGYDGSVGVIQARTVGGAGKPIYLNYGIGNVIMGGNVGIGTTSPTYKLTVGNGTNTDKTIMSAYFEGNISAAGYITRTSTYDLGKGDALDNIHSTDYYLDNGIINHSKFYGGTTWEVQDISRPVETSSQVETCNDIPVMESVCIEQSVCGYELVGTYYQNICTNQTICNDQQTQSCNNYFKEQCSYESVFDEILGFLGYNRNCTNVEIQNCTGITIQNCSTETVITTTYPFNKIEEGVSLDLEMDLFRQGLAEFRSTSDVITLGNSTSPALETTHLIVSELSMASKTYDKKDKTDKEIVKELKKDHTNPDGSLNYSSYGDLWKKDSVKKQIKNPDGTITEVWEDKDVVDLLSYLGKLEFAVAKQIECTELAGNFGDYKACMV